MKFGNWMDVGRMDELGRMDTPAHRLDARAKAFTTLAFLVFVMSFPRYEISALTPFFLYPFALISLGRIPPGLLARKILVAAPFAVILGMFNPFLDRQPMLEIGPWIVSGGWLSFASILLRFALTVGAALALVACTGMYPLCAGLERMGLPRIFAVQLLLLYRYLFVITNEGSRMVRSMAIRAPELRFVPLRVYGSLAGHLLLRSLSRADRMYQAMVARGFDGEIRVMRPSGFRWADVAFVCGWLAFFAAARQWNLAEGLGRLLSGGLS